VPIDAKFLILPDPPAPPAPEPTPPDPHAVTPTNPSAQPAPKVPQAYAVQPEEAAPTAVAPVANERPLPLVTPLPTPGAIPTGRPARSERVAPIGVATHVADEPPEDFVADSLHPDIVGGGTYTVPSTPECDDAVHGFVHYEGTCKRPYVFSRPGEPICGDGPRSFADTSEMLCGRPLELAIRAYNLKEYSKAFAGFADLAERQDYSPAQYRLAVMYAEGIGVEKDLSKAVFWYLKAAKDGDDKAQFNLAQLYENGAEGIPKDESQAVHWYTLAAYHMNSAAQSNLGLMYATGTGVPQDFTQAVYWYRAAAARGNSVGLYNLGLAYANGTGVPQDGAQAALWWRKGADRGNANAQYSLAQLYSQGTGVPKDPETAYFWCSLAALKDNEAALADRDALAQLLTPAQRAGVDAAVRDWKHK
jgi:TPR repeat protein